MRIRIQRHGLVPAVLVTVLGVVALYLASTEGWAALRSSGSAPSSSIGTLPQVVARAPASVATTEDYGPLGPVSLVYAGTEVRDGLLGELDPVWLMVSSQDGDTRAVSAEDLPDPAAGALSVSPDGDRLAWLHDATVHLYDTTTGNVTEIPVTGATGVGAFSPDGSRLLVDAADALGVVDLTSGDVVSQFVAAEGAARRAAWRPDGTTVDFVSGRHLVSGRVPGSDVTTQETDIPERAQVAWSGGGGQLVSLQPVQGVRRLFVSPLGEAGRLAAAERVAVPGVSPERVLGFTGEHSVAVLAYALESGAVQRVLDVPLTGGEPGDLTTLPEKGENWAGSQTLAVAADTLPFGSTAFDEPVWPWTYVSRLVACIILGFFLLGLFVTRRRRS